MLFSLIFSNVPFREPSEKICDPLRLTLFSGDGFSRIALAFVISMVRVVFSPTSPFSRRFLSFLLICPGAFNKINLSSDSEAVTVDEARAESPSQFWSFSRWLPSSWTICCPAVSNGVDSLAFSIFPWAGDWMASLLLSLPICSSFSEGLSLFFLLSSSLFLF